jgi:hypothetical protein
MLGRVKIDKRLSIIGVIIVVLSTTIATQYASTKISYTFTIVHPAETGVRFIASDNCSDDGLRCLRVANNASPVLSLNLGEWFPNSTKNYTAAFGIVNENNYTVNITHIQIIGDNTSYIDIWVHGNRSEDYPDEGDCSTRVKVVDNGASLYHADSCVWQLAIGDSNSSSMDGTNIETPWDETSHIRYSKSDIQAINVTDDYVWVGISLKIPPDSALQAATGKIYVHFKAETTP